MPHHSVPRLGSACPNEGIDPWAAATGHPWPGAANPASLPGYPRLNACVRPSWLTGLSDQKPKPKQDGGLPAGLGVLPVAAAEPARLRSTPKGAQGLEIAEGLRPYRSLRQRLQGGVCCEAVGCASSVGARLARDGVRAGSAFLDGVHIHSCGNGGSGFRPYGGSLLKSAKVSKTLLPHHSVPRLGSACPNEGIDPWAAAPGHPWPGAANPASLPGYPRLNACVRPSWLTGRSDQKPKPKQDGGLPAGLGVLPVAAAEPARLRSTPKGAQGLEIAEGLRPYRSLRQRLQGGVSSVGARLARDEVREVASVATALSACRRRKACGTMAAHVFWKLPG